MRNCQLNGELPLLAAIRGPAPVDAVTLASFGDEEESAIRSAVLWAWRNRRIKGMGLRRAAELCGIKAPHFSNIVNTGIKYLPPHKINQFEWVLGTTAVSQTIRRFSDARQQQLRVEVGELVAEHLGRVA